MKLNGIEIPHPKKMNINPVKLSVVSRTASGRRVEDLIATKRNFTLNYLGLKPLTLLLFKNIYFADKEVGFEYEDAQGIQTATVKMTTFPQELLKENLQYSQNVTIALEEV